MGGFDCSLSRFRGFYLGALLSSIEWTAVALVLEEVDDGILYTLVPYSGACWFPLWQLSSPSHWEMSAIQSLKWVQVREVLWHWNYCGELDFLWWSVQADSVHNEVYL